MPHIYHGITGWTRTGNATFTENKSGLKIAQLTYRCAAVTTTPPFIADQALPIPFDSYRVYPTPKITISDDGISSAVVDAYSVNFELKQDEARFNLTEASGDYYYSGVTTPVTVNVRYLTRGAYVKDAQTSSAITTAPSTSIVGQAIFIEAKIGNQNIPQSHLSVSTSFSPVSVVQNSFGVFSEIEAIYQTRIISVSGEQP